MAGKRANERVSRGQRTGRASVGILTAIGIAGGGWWFLREPAERFGDLDRSESLRAGEYSEPVPTVNPTGESRLPEDPPFTLGTTRVEYRISANAAQAAVYGLPADRVRTWGLLVDESATPMERDAIVLALRSAGVTIDANQITDSASEFATVTGTWNGLLVLVNVHRGETITITLIDR